jgi:rubrerythrin
MDFEKLQNVVKFAIDKEIEAAAFYRDLASKCETGALQQELLKIADIEDSHKEKLQRMDVEETAKTSPKEVMDLQISDYLVEKEPTPDMSWQDILTIAMKREQAAFELYTNLAKMFATENTISQLFQNLASEESSHKLYFEKIYDDEILKEN